MAVNDHLIFTQMTDPKFLNKTGLSLQEMFDHYFQMKKEGAISQREEFQKIIQNKQR